MFHLFHKAVAVLVLRKIGIDILQALQHVGKAAPDHKVGVRRAIQTAAFGGRQCRRGADSDFKVLGGLGGPTKRRENRGLNTDKFNN